MKINFIRGNEIPDKTYIHNAITLFCLNQKIVLNEIVVDMRKTVNNYTTEGMFGGFVDMYNKKTNTMYINPWNFIEYISPKPDAIIHLIMHELIHTKQIKTGEMRINKKSITYKGKKYKRIPFKVDLFNKIRKLDTELAEEYHKTTLPWEKDAYDIPAKFMGKSLSDHY